MPITTVQQISDETRRGNQFRKPNSAATSPEASPVGTVRYKDLIETFWGRLQSFYEQETLCNASGKISKASETLFRLNVF